MKTTPKLALFALSMTLSLGHTQAVEKEVWYNAKGEVVKITKAQKTKKPFVPDWKKREIARLQALRNGRPTHRVQRYTDTYYYARPYYGGYGGYHHGYHGGGSIHGTYHGKHGSIHAGFHRGSGLHFNGVYHGKGWSVRLRR